MGSAHGASEAKLVVVIDDDPMVLEATGGLLRSWGYLTVTAVSDRGAMSQLAKYSQLPHLIICDYHLADGTTGIEAIERLRKTFQIPAIIITGDTAAERLREAHACGYHVLYKPVSPRPLRAMLKRVLRDTACPDS
jgi:CheY-like chemotaxis protein